MVEYVLPGVDKRTNFRGFLFIVDFGGGSKELRRLSDVLKNRVVGY